MGRMPPEGSYGTDQLLIDNWPAAADSIPAIGTLLAKLTRNISVIINTLLAKFP